MRITARLTIFPWRTRVARDPGMSRVVGWPGGAAPQVELDRCRGLAGSVHALSDEGVASLVFALSFAGHETTTSLLGNTLRQLLLRPELWKRPCADRSLIDGAIEETLRYDTPVPAWRRVTTRPTTLGGVSLPEGARLVLAFGAGNHDALALPRSGSFRHRPPRSQTADLVRQGHPRTAWVQPSGGWRPES